MRYNPKINWQQKSRLAHVWMPNFHILLGNLGAVLDKNFVRYEKVKKKGYARITTNVGDINIELHCELVCLKRVEEFMCLPPVSLLVRAHSGAQDL